MAARVAVVGAGLAGLSAGLELKRLGCEVELFERSRLLGGKATSFVVDGVEVDCGQHVYLGCCTAFVEFVEAAGMGAALRLQPRFEVLVLRRGEPPSTLRAARLPAPLHLLPALLAYRPLGWSGRVAVGRALARAATDGRGADQVTFATWLGKQGGRGPREAFWEPFLVPALNAELDEVSAASALFVLRTAFLGQEHAARIGMLDVPLGRVAEAAAGRLDAVHRRRSISDLGRLASFDAVVLAVPPAQAARLLGDRMQMARFQSRPIVDVHLWYEGAELDLSFAALLRSPVQWVFQKAPGYLCCSLSAAGHYVRWAEKDLVSLADGELRAVLPQMAGARLVRGAATRDPEATFLPGPGLRRPGPKTPIPSVALAGAWTDTGWPATMESAVRSGRAAVRHLQEVGALG